MNERFGRLWPPALLLFSLGLNCLLVGLMAGRGWERREAYAAGTLTAATEPGPTDHEAPAPRSQPAKPDPMPLAGFGGRVQALSAEDRHAFIAGMQPFQRGIREARHQLAASRRAAAEVIEREPYDATAVTAALADARAKMIAVQERVQEAAVKALAGVSVAGRQILVK